MPKYFPDKVLTYKGLQFNMSQVEVRLIGNSYENISMGAFAEVGNHTFKGCLIRFARVQSALLTRESFKNVGAFTVDHLEYVLKQMKPNVNEVNDQYVKGSFQGGLD